MYNYESKESKQDLEEKITLEVLSAVEVNSQITQRSIASKLGIALGLTNAYLKRCAEKGLLKIQQVPRKRYSYYLTPKGFSEKARLTAQYFKSSFDFFRRARHDCEDLIVKSEERGFKKVVLSDISEIAEVFILSALGARIKIIGLIGNRSNEFYGLPIYKDFLEAEKFDVIFLTAIINPQERYKEILRNFDESKILIPDLIRIRLKK